MELLCFIVWFFRGTCISPWRRICLCSGWFRKRNWGWVCEILRWGTQPCRESSHGICIKFVTIFHITLAMVGTFVHARYFIGAGEAPIISSGCDDIPTEAETRSQFRHRLAVVTLLVPLASNAPVTLASASRERSRELLEEAFDNGMYHFRWEYFCGVPWLILSSCGCFFRPFQQRSCCDAY